MLLLVAVAVLFTACATPASYLGVALIQRTTEPTLITDNAAGFKTGKACGKNYLGIFATGDLSVETAKKNGGIKTVASVDREVAHSVIISKVCTVVTGN